MDYQKTGLDLSKCESIERILALPPPAMFIVCRLGSDRTRNFLPNPNRTEPPIFVCRTEPNFCAYDLVQ